MDTGDPAAFVTVEPGGDGAPGELALMSVFIGKHLGGEILDTLGNILAAIFLWVSRAIDGYFLKPVS